MRPRNDARLVPAAVGVYGVTATVSRGVVDPGWWVVIGLGGVLLLVGARRASPGAAFAALAIAVASGVTVIHLDSRLSGGVGEALVSGEEVVFVGVALNDPRPIEPGPFTRTEARWCLTVRIEALEGEGAGSTRATITVVGGEPWSQVRSGDRVWVGARLDSAGPGRSAAIAWDPALLETVPVAGINGVVGDLREGLRDAASGLPDEIRALTIGMTIGDTSGMTEAQAMEMRIAGLTHLTAVSGAQFAMLAVAIGAGARALRWNRRVRVVVLVLATIGFVSLVHPEPSVLRAAWMGGVLALALWWGRPGQALPALSTAVIGLLLADPLLSLSYGFALSVVATAGIVLWSPTVAALLARAIPVPLARALSIPIAAQIFCTPILVLFCSGIGSYSVLANLIALPFAALVTAFGITAVLVSPLWEPAGVACAWVAGEAARPVAWAAHTAATLPGGWLPWPSGLAGALLATGVSVSLVAATSTRRIVGWARLAGLVTILTIVAASPPVRAVLGEVGQRAPDDWAVAVCDVGQGDMILIRAGPASAVVVDVGPEGGEALACLTRHQVSMVPLLVLTHPHADHDGGLEWVLRQVPVGEAWVSAPGEVADECRILREAGVNVEVPTSGTSVRVGEAQIFVWHDGDSAARKDSEVNESSLVVFATTREIGLLSLGDLEQRGQASLARTLGQISVDVLKVAHHGSSRQDSGLMSSVTFALAVISVGEDNAYGHPASSTLEALEGKGAPVFRTDSCGDIDVSWRGDVVVSARCP